MKQKKPIRGKTKEISMKNIDIKVLITSRVKSEKYEKQKKKAQITGLITTKRTKPRPVTSAARVPSFQGD